MCGFAGLFSRWAIDGIGLRIERMTKSLVHRGPDAGSQAVLSPHLALGHRRLKIIDLSDAANQPFTSASGRYTIVFNGEIYNFKEIRDQLDYPFQTNCDTEVLVAALERKDMDWFLSRAVGMFAFAAHDRQEDRLTLVRDRFGVKPLYYAFDGTTFVFGSEIKAILHSGLVEADFHEEMVDTYLAQRHLPAPHTFFKSIRQVEPGTMLTIARDFQTATRRYWTLPALNFDSTWDEARLLEEVGQELARAVECRMISDVPVGTYLSGGLDSSLVTALATRHAASGLNTYTIGFGEDGFNEFPFSRRVADLYGTLHHEILMDKDGYLEEWPELIYYKDAPLGVPNEIPLARMSKILKEKITVVLSGEGADELFGGYGRIFRAPFEFRKLSGAAGAATGFQEFFLDRYEYVPGSLRRDLLVRPPSLRTWYGDSLQAMFQDRRPEEAVFRFFHDHHIQGLLQRMDATTMYASVEGRVPFLDHLLVEKVYTQVPYDLKLKWLSDAAREEAAKQDVAAFSETLDTPKYLLKKMSEKFLPDDIIYRKKLGFPVPLNVWFPDLERLAKDRLTGAGWLRQEQLNALVEKSRTHDRAGQILWMFINVQLFHDRYFRTTWRY